MKRFTLLILCACTCSALLASSDTLRILGIGNSFTMDAMAQHLQPIMTSMDQPAIMAYPYRGGTTLQQHDMWKSRTDTCPYNYYEWRNGELTSGGDRSANFISSVEKEPWDYIIFQTDHAIAGKIKSYEPYLTDLINYAKLHCSNKNVKIGLYMTWAYDSVSTYDGFRHYGYDTDVMYDSIINCVQQVMANHKADIDFLIPVGTAIQNGRTSYIGHRMNRDGYHLNYNHGRFIASLCWSSVIGKYNPDSVPFYPETISEYCANMCRAAVKGALNLPYDTTSLRAEFGKSESESQPADESRLQRVTFNGLSVPIIEGVYDYTVKINTALPGKVTMYSYPISSKAEQNITNQEGADIPRDPEKYGYFPLTAPAFGETVTYVNKVIAEDLIHSTTYTFRLVGAKEADLVYTIGSLDDLQDFAAAVNGGQYGLNAELIQNVVLDMEKQACWRTPIGTIEHPYTGTFDGKGYMLRGFNIYNKNDLEFWAMTSLGLFGAIKGATIKNLTLTTMDECYFLRPGDGDPATNLTCCGVLTGWMANSIIANCTFDCDVYTTMKSPVGTVCGLEDGSYGPSVIDRCQVFGTWRARSTNYYAGFVGQANNLTISNSSCHARMPLETNHGAHIAGFVGLSQSSESGRFVALRNCYFAGYINDDREAKGVETSSTPYLASFISYVKGANTDMLNCYWLKKSAPKAVSTTKNNTHKLAATTFAQANLTDSTLIGKLGGAFIQGENYPVIGEKVLATSLVERFSQYNDNSWNTSANPAVVKNGDLCDWMVFHSRRKASDVLANGERATWFANSNDGYIQTNTAWEGGVKAISFLWNKFEKKTEDIKFSVSVGKQTDTVTVNQVPDSIRRAVDLEYLHAFNVKQNAVIKIANHKKTLHIGPISITPYIGFTQKQMLVSFSEVKDVPFANPSWFDNTDDEGEITFSCSDDQAAKVDSVGQVTITAIPSKPIVVTAMWKPSPEADSVTASYQIVVEKRNKRLAQFAQSVIKVQLGDTAVNALQMRTSVDDTPAVPQVTYVSSNSSVATVNGQQIQAVGLGTATITAYVAQSDLYFADSASYSMNVTFMPNPDSYVTETFSNCAAMDTAGTVIVAGDHGWFTWKMTNFRNNAGSDKVGDQRGNRVRYEGSLAFDGVQEGGIKSVLFDWRASADSMPVHFYVQAGKVTDDYRHDPLASTSIINSYAKLFNVKSNTTMSVSMGKKEKPQQSFVVVGPIKIMPYLFYTVKDTTIQAGYYLENEITFQNDQLIDNTDGEGTVSYALLGDSASEIASVDAKGNISILGSGTVTVQASWGDVSTSYQLTILPADPQLSFDQELVTVTIDEGSYVQTVRKATPAEVTYSFDGEAGTATIDETTGEVYFTDPGWYTIKATVPAMSPYSAGETSYLLVVEEGTSGLYAVPSAASQPKQLINQQLLIYHDTKCYDAQGRQR